MYIYSSRWFLYIKAPILRALMKVGMKLHHFAEPKSPKPNFKIAIPSRLSARGGTFKLVFYLPESFTQTPDNYRYPLVVNFHGGGFTLGTATDDARWARTVTEDVEAVFVSVEYRLAPEYPFSVGVEDGTDAVIYLASHAKELRLDPHRIALSGFSAGGNFVFTVPIMLRDLQNHTGKRSLAFTSSPFGSQDAAGASNSTFSSSLSLSYPPSIRITSATSSTSILGLSYLEPTPLETNQSMPDLTIKCIIAFYPPVDFRQSRAEKRGTNPVPKKNLPSMLTKLFDDSYIDASSMIDLTDPYLSPAAASDALLKAAYPQEIVLYTCEYDMLNAEGVAFGKRLAGDGIGKTVHGGLIKEVVHAFDKKPNPIHFPKIAERCYAEVCAELRRVYRESINVTETSVLELSKSVDRFEEGHLGDVLVREGTRSETSDRDVCNSDENVGRPRVRITPPSDDSIRYTEHMNFTRSRHHTVSNTSEYMDNSTEQII